MRKTTLLLFAGLIVAGCNKKTPDDLPEGIEQPTPDDQNRKAKPGGDGRPEAPPKGLEILPNAKWKVPRHLLDRWEDNPSRLGTAEEHNKGYKLKVRNNSPGWWLGLRTGDVVVKVNDLPIDTKMQLLSTWMKVKNKDRLVLKIRRDGDLLEHTYVIVD